MTTYKTKNGQDAFLPGIGQTVSGTIETDTVIENPNFEAVSTAATVAPAPIPAPAPQVSQPVIEATKETIS